MNPPRFPIWFDRRPSVNLRQVGPSLFIGALDSPQVTRWAAVVDLYGSTPDADLSIPFNDGATFPPGALARIERLTHWKRHEGNVLIHCQAGLSRSASAAAAMLMVQDGLSEREALRRVHEGAGRPDLPQPVTLESAMAWVRRRER